MERKELVVGLQNTFKAVTESLVAAMNEIRMNMNDKVAVIAKAKRELAEENETLIDISVAVEDFVEDLTMVAGDMEEITSAVSDMLYDLDEVPDTLETYTERTERMYENFDINDIVEEEKEIAE